MNPRSGCHFPNVPLPQFSSQPNGPVECPAAVWRRVLLGQFGWVKLLWPDHGRCEAEMARALGLKVLVRAPGEGTPHWEAVMAMLLALAGACDVIEVGNEPPAADLWTTAWYLEQIAQHCGGLAARQDITLLAPAWQGLQDPPNRWDLRGDATRAALAVRLQTVYKQFGGLAVHCYDAERLDAGSVKDHLAFWNAWLPSMPLYITEYGIARRVLPGAANEDSSNLLKAARYAAFVKGLPSYVTAAFAFILGGTAEFAAFSGSSYDPTGPNGYWLDEGAWAAFGKLTNSPGVGS